MEQTKALNALAPFLALTKSATSPRAAADLIIRATSAPNTYIFSELLATPQIQSLSTSPEYSNHLTLLQIFSYGTYTDYFSTPSLPALTPPQLLKLRQLSFLTLAKIPSNLTYTSLLSALALETPRELEDLVISTIYAGLVTATLDPYNQLILVSSISPLRDLPPNTIPTMLSTLAEWSLRCNSTLLDLEKQIASIKAAATKRSREEKEWAEKVEKLADSKTEKSTFEEERKSAVNGGGNGGGPFAGVGKKLGGNFLSAGKRANSGLDGDEDDMELDEDEDEFERRSSKSSKKRGFMGFGK